MFEQRAVLTPPAQKSIIEVPLHDAPSREASGWIAGEPSVQDILRDPLIHAVLNRDGLSLNDLLQAIALGRSRLTAPAAESDAA